MPNRFVVMVLLAASLIHVIVPKPVHSQGLMHSELLLIAPPLPDLGSVEVYLPVAQLSRKLRISLSQRQVTLYEGETVVKQYPVAVGKSGWETPLGQHRVMQMMRNPAWKSPFDGSVIPAGDPDNPLGQHWIGFWSDGKNVIGFHGTPNPRSVGRAVSHGCVRMHNQHIQELFEQVTVGTLVEVVP